ncbi:uncharacterized protein LOC120681125 [Panicum virgatum]|uniref:uncharacterized protein LOC120681125 n=1 Tax=Panicum virgatum TaxID=38727 RepID=UPI0019D4F489|nr:uncharacterized protein LOC120681125 [Panicum virgatum]
MIPPDSHKRKRWIPVTCSPRLDPRRSVAESSCNEILLFHPAAQPAGGASACGASASTSPRRRRPAAQRSWRILPGAVPSRRWTRSSRGDGGGSGGEQTGAGEELGSGVRASASGGVHDHGEGFAGGDGLRARVPRASSTPPRILPVEREPRRLTLAVRAVSGSPRPDGLPVPRRSPALADVVAVAPTSTPLSASSAIDFLTLCHRLKTTKRKGCINHSIKGSESIADHMYRVALMTLITGDLPAVPLWVEKGASLYICFCLSRLVRWSGGGWWVVLIQKLVTANWKANIGSSCLKPRRISRAIVVWFEVK